MFHRPLFAGFQGAIGSLLANPFDLLKVRMQGGDLNQARMSEALLNSAARSVSPEYMAQLDTICLYFFQLLFLSVRITSHVFFSPIVQPKTAFFFRCFSQVVAATRAVYREAGPLGLWRGAGPTVQRATLLTASQAGWSNPWVSGATAMFMSKARDDAFLDLES